VAARPAQHILTLRRRRRRLAPATGLLAPALLCAWLAPSAFAADRVYWANDQSTNRISFAALDGSGGGDLKTSGASAGAPRGVAIDVAAGKIWWTKPGSGTGDGRISFANLDGSGAGGDLNTAGATVDRPNAAAIYPAAGRIYWANELGDRISFANLDNSGGGDLSVTGATVNVPIGPVIEPSSGRIYWGNANPENKISYAQLDGSGGGDLNTAGATVANPHGLALDPVAGRIYWANVGIGAENTGQGISYANLDGSGGGDFAPGAAMVNVPVGVAIDPFARKIYWANQAGNRISVANLDGGGGRNLSTPGATLKGSRSPVLLRAPSAAGAPALTGGSTAGSVLTCSSGSWAPDLLGSWLYRAPQRLAYSWTRDGAVIPGAAGRTLRAGTGGGYRCRVIASNPAGSSSQTSAAHAVSAPPGSSSPTGPGKTQPPAFGASALVAMSIGARRIPSRGPIKVVLINRNHFTVSGELSGKTTRRLAFKGTRFVLAADTRKSVRLKLSRNLRRVLRRDGKLSVRFAAKVTDPAGNIRTVRKNGSVRLKTA
jgi:hypothetical protein